MTQLAICVDSPGKDFSVDGQRGGEVLAHIDSFENQGRGEKQLTCDLFN